MQHAPSRVTAAVSAFLLIASLAWADNPPVFGGVWLKGDLHAHSNQSDGINSVSDHIKKAQTLGFDYYVITDHDNSPLTMGYPAQWHNANYRSTSMILLYGMEWTTAKGHANILKDAMFNYGPLWTANRANNADAAQTAAAEQGALFSINHPESHLWKYPLAYLPDAVEIWNLPFCTADLVAFQGRAFYDDLLRAGNRVPLVGGSDTHTLTGAYSWLWGSEHKYSGLGKPTTWVYAQARTGAAILEAIRNGRASVTYDPAGPRLEFAADANQDGRYDDARMGDEIACAGQPIAFQVNVAGNPGGGGIIDFDNATIQALLNRQLRFVDIKNWMSQQGYASYDLLLIYKDGVLFRFTALLGGANAYTFRDTPSASAYYRPELHRIPTPNPGPGNAYMDGVTAISNPIYVVVQN